MTSRGAHNIQNSQDIQKVLHVSGAPIVLKKLYVFQNWKILGALGMIRVVLVTNTIDTLQLFELLNMLGAHGYPCIALEIHGCKCVSVGVDVDVQEDTRACVGSVVHNFVFMRFRNVCAVRSG